MRKILMGSIQLYLASSSPRRAQLLEQIGVRYTILKPQISEAIMPGESPEELVQRLAIDKARAGEEMTNGGPPVLGADTIVVLRDRILGKPSDRHEAQEMLAQLSGQVHRVLTAVAICQKDRIETALNETLVQFRHLTIEEQINYSNSDEPMDKAGSYGIQGRGAVFVKSITGSYSGVVGLPLMETARLLSMFDIDQATNAPID